MIEWLSMWQRVWRSVIRFDTGLLILRINWEIEWFWEFIAQVFVCKLLYIIQITRLCWPCLHNVNISIVIHCWWILILLNIAVMGSPVETQLVSKWWMTLLKINWCVQSWLSLHRLVDVGSLEHLLLKWRVLLIIWGERTLKVVNGPISIIIIVLHVTWVVKAGLNLFIAGLPCSLAGLFIGRKIALILVIVSTVIKRTHHVPRLVEVVGHLWFGLLIWKIVVWYLFNCPIWISYIGVGYNNSKIIK